MYIIFGYNILIHKAKLNSHWALDSTYNFTKGFNQILIMMYLDKITNKLYPFIMVLMSKKNIESYEEIFKNIKLYINEISETKELNLKSYCTDYEEALFKGFHNIFSNSKNDLQHIGCYFHYLQGCRRKLQTLHFTSKKNINIYNDFMNKFGNFAFIKNISKKKNFKGIE